MIPYEYHSLTTKTLTKEEYEKLAQEIRDGGFYIKNGKIRANNEDAVNKIVVGYARNSMLTAALAAPSNANSSTIDLALMVGITALVETTHRWAAKGVDNQIRPYLKANVRSAVWSFFQREFRRKALTWDPPDIKKKKVEADIFEKVAQDWVDKQILHYRIEGHTQEEVGDLLGLKQSTVSRRIKIMQSRYDESN